MTLEQQTRKNIAYYRNLKNLSQKDLADLLGVTQSKIARMENLKGKTPIFLDRLEELAKALGVKVNDLLQDPVKSDKDIESDNDIMQRILFELSKYFDKFTTEQISAERRATCTFFIYKTIFSIKKNSGDDYKLTFAKGIFASLIEQGMNEKVIKIEDF